jgi:hypothetical protein
MKPKNKELLKKFREVCGDQLNVVDVNGELVTQKIVEVSQFFDYKKMTWKELCKGEEKGVLPSTDGKKFLWGEKPKIKEVTHDEEPDVGDVWLRKSIDGKAEVYKANYDSSD